MADLRKTAPLPMQSLRITPTTHEKGSSEVFLTKMEMYRTDDRNLSFKRRGPSSKRYEVPVRSAKKPWKSRAFCVSVATLVVGGMVVGILAATGVINTGGYLSSTNSDLQGFRPTPGTGQKPTTPGTRHRLTTPETGQRPSTPGTGQNPTTPETGQHLTTPGTGQNPTTPGTGYRLTTPETGQRSTTPGTGQLPTTLRTEQHLTTPGAGQPSTTPATPPSTLQVRETTRKVTTTGHDRTTAQPTTFQPRATAPLSTEGTNSIHGGWTTWAAWQDCDVTCGGGVQRRTRMCTNPPPANGGLHCAGRDVQKKICSDWECPDCARVCAVGTLNAACDTCTCDNHVLDGHVTDTRNAPLDGAEVYLAEKPWEVASTTNSTGRFVLTGACSQGVLILVKRGGYFEEYGNSTQRDSETSSVAVKMRVMESPIMDENPVGKVRFVGQDVTFCCRAHGTPMPSSYEWFKDDRVLDDDVYHYNETLTLYDLQTGDSGVYKCRANSDAGAKYSAEAVLTVYDNGTAMCNSTPATNLIDLPDDCVQPDTNTTNYNIGACSRQKCGGDLGEDDKDCQDTRSFCCVPVASETRTVQCSDYSLDVTVTTSCGCGVCVEGTKRVRGRAFGMKNGTEIPLSYGTVSMNDQIQGWTTQTGEFEVDVPATLDRVALTFKDPFFKRLVTTTKVLSIQDGVEPYYTVRMQVRPPVSPLNASETSTINLGTLSNEPAIAEVDIPPNSFFTESGDPYTGTVQASVGFIDPRNPDDFDDIQSDLTTVDEEGTQQALRTFGMFSMDFEDDSGNPVVVGGKMTMHIDPEQVNINPFDVDENGNLNTKLWSMNPNSGEWEFAGNLRVGTARRRKRQAQTFFIGEFEYRGDWVYNIDLPEQQNRACYVKVRVYKNENAAKNAIASEQEEQGAQVTVITIDTSPGSTSTPWEPSNSLSRYDVGYAYSDGVCVATFCDPSGSEFNASVQVFHGDNHYKVLHIDDHPSVSNWSTNLTNSIEHHDEMKTIVFDVFKPAITNDARGPVYEFKDRRQCDVAPIGDNHIAFYNAEYQPYRFPPYVFIEEYYNKPINALSWYSVEKDLGSTMKKVCFIKVRVSFPFIPDSNIEIRTKSEGGGDYAPNSGKVYGIRDDRTQTDSGDSFYGFTCVEFKCPGEIRTSAGGGAPSIPLPGNPQDNVRLTVVAKDPDCYYSDKNSNLDIPADVSSLSSEGNKVEFTVPHSHDFGATKGIYIRHGDMKVGYDLARNYCMKGTEGNEGESMLNWGLEFTCNDFYTFF